METKNYNEHIRPADRIATVQEYYFSTKGKEVARMNAEGKNVISLAIGSPDMPPSKETIDVLCENARLDNAHGYQPTVGIPELRKAMAGFYKRWYGVDLNPDTEIQPLIGSKEGILHVTLALCNVVQCGRQSAGAKSRLPHLHLTQPHPRHPNSELRPAGRERMAARLRTVGGDESGRCENHVDKLSQHADRRSCHP